MCARIRTVLGAGDLEHVLARLQRGHAELLLGRPRLHPRHGRARAEAVVHRLAVERDRHLDVAAAVQVGLDAGMAGMVADEAVLVHRLVTVFEVDQGLLGETVLLDDRDLDGGEAVPRAGFEMRDLADPLVSFTALGLIVSAVSDDLQRRASDAAHREQILAEAKRTNEITISGQLLTSLSFKWEMISSNAALREMMKKGQAEIEENAESSQGGSPRVAFEVEEYKAALNPLLFYIAQTGGERTFRSTYDAAEEKIENPTFALVALDSSSNAVLSFGSIPDGVDWIGKDKKATMSGGFVTVANGRAANSTPRVHITDGVKAASTYSIEWDLDPSTLANAIDRNNGSIAPTAKLPATLKVALFYNVKRVPFRQGNFADSATSIWKGNESAKEEIDFDEGDFTSMALQVEVNGFPEMRYSYSLNKMYEVTLTDDFDDEYETGCVLLEFKLKV